MGIYVGSKTERNTYPGITIQLPWRVSLSQVPGDLKGWCIRALSSELLACFGISLTFFPQILALPWL